MDLTASSLHRSPLLLIILLSCLLPLASAFLMGNSPPCAMDTDCPYHQCCVKIRQNSKWRWLLKRLPPALCISRDKAKNNCGGLGPGLCRSQAECAPTECCRTVKLDPRLQKFGLSVGKCTPLGQDGAKCIVDIPAGVTSPVPACPCGHDVDCFSDGRTLPVFGQTGTCMLGEARFCFGPNECRPNECCRIMRMPTGKRRKRQTPWGDPFYGGGYGGPPSRRYVYSRAGSTMHVSGPLGGTAPSPVSEAAQEQSQTFHEMAPPGWDRRTWGVCVNLGSVGSQCMVKSLMRAPRGLQYLCPCARGLECMADGGMHGPTGYTGVCNRTRPTQCRSDMDCAPNECCKSMLRPGEAPTIHVGGICSPVGGLGEECMAGNLGSLFGGGSRGVKLFCKCRRDLWCVPEQGGSKQLFGLRGRCRRTENGGCATGNECFEDECCMSNYLSSLFSMAARRKKRQLEMSGMCQKMGSRGQYCPTGYPSQKPDMVVLQCPCKRGLQCQAPSNATKPFRYMGIPQGECK